MNEKTAKWQRWLNDVKQQMRSLFWSRQIFNETIEVIRANPLLPQENSFYGAMQMWYAASVLSGIRRQLKSSDQSISLVRILEEIRDQPALLSRTRWRTLHVGTSIPISMVDLSFTRLVGNGETVDSASVEADLVSLKAIAQKCEAYTDKRVAHHDRGLDPELPTYNDLNATLSALDELFQKYYLLVTGDNALTEANIAYNWKQVFHHPWAPLAP